MTAQQKPNLLLIWTDEQRPDTLHSYGNTQTQTPNFDRLAAKSTVFENAYCTSPVCTPSRGSILCGVWPHQHGAIQNNIPLNATTPTLAEMVSPDVSTAYLGKWHLGDEIFAQHGWDTWISFEDNYANYYNETRDRSQRSTYHHYLKDLGFPCDLKTEWGPMYSRGYTASLGEPHTKAAWLAREAAREIKERNVNRSPWCMSVNFLEPHMPFYGPLNHHYNPEDLETGPLFRQSQSEPLPASYAAQAEKHMDTGYDGQDLRTEKGWRRLMANYYGLVEMVDHAVGTILQALEDSGQAENTLVVFTSDHGEMMGSYSMLGKGVFYQQSVQVPLMIHLPGQHKARSISQSVSQIDLVPTLLDLMGEDVPGHLAGQSRAGVLRDGHPLPDEDIFLVWNPQNQQKKTDIKSQTWRGMVSREGWKFAVCAEGDLGLLFDLKTDPLEKRNRIMDPNLQELREELTRRLQTWLQHQQDPFHWPATT